jgi:hypothetical protein
MTEPQQPDPEPPAPPGTSDRAVDVDIPIDPDEGGAVPGNEDVTPEAGATEPPD